MPLANSMTCAENLIGFNSGGYKAPSHSLNIQVPFTEATLFTPRKCFKRAVEKCYDDFLSSIIASCSWDKHMVVRIRSRFNVMWDWKEVGFDQMSKDNLVLKHGLGFDQMNGMDVYNFLYMVSSAGGTNSNTACLGEEVDDLMEVLQRKFEITL